MSETLSTWKEVRRLADELELEIHLASMEARDRWEALQPRLLRLEQSVAHAGHRIGEAIDREVASISAVLERLREDVPPPPNE
jgi:hypothetical protein